MNAGCSYGEFHLIWHLLRPRPVAEVVDLFVESIFKVRPVLGGYHLVYFYYPLGQSVLGPEDENRFVFAYFRNVYLSILS